MIATPGQTMSAKIDVATCGCDCRQCGFQFRCPDRDDVVEYLDHIAYEDSLAYCRVCDALITPEHYDQLCFHCSGMDRMPTEPPDPADRW